jgi:hypothetical protein
MEHAGAGGGTGTVGLDGVGLWRLRPEGGQGAGCETLGGPGRVGFAVDLPPARAAVAKDAVTWQQ